MARVHSDRIARIRKYNTFLRLENETIRPNIPLLFRLISNPQDHLPTPPPNALPFPSKFYGNTLCRVVSLKRMKIDR